MQMRMCRTCISDYKKRDIPMKKAIILFVCLISVLSACKPADAPVTTPAVTAEPVTITVAEEEVVDKPDYSAFNGDYNDAFSQRAYATLTENADWESVNIKVWWADSAASFYMWEMNATYDGEKLNYSDCRSAIYTTDEVGNDTEELRYENSSGYFVWDNGILRWTGAEDPDCRYCVFTCGDGPFTMFGRTILVSGEQKTNGADVPAAEKEWTSLGESEIVLDTNEKAFRMWDWEPSEDDVMQNVVLALGREPGESFELNFEYGDCSVDYRYTILELR